MEAVHLNAWKTAGKFNFRTTTSMTFTRTVNHICNDIVAVPALDDLDDSNL